MAVGGEARKLHEVGRGEEFAQLVDLRGILVRLQSLDDLLRGHLHGVEAEALAHIPSQRLRQQRVVFLLVVVPFEACRLDLVDAPQGLLVGRLLA